MGRKWQCVLSAPQTMMRRAPMAVKTWVWPNNGLPCCSPATRAKRPPCCSPAIHANPPPAAMSTLQGKALEVKPVGCRGASQQVARARETCHARTARFLQREVASFSRALTLKQRISGELAPAALARIVRVCLTWCAPSPTWGANLHHQKQSQVYRARVGRGAATTPPAVPTRVAAMRVKTGPAALCWIPSLGRKTGPRKGGIGRSTRRRGRREHLGWCIIRGSPLTPCAVCCTLEATAAAAQATTSYHGAWPTWVRSCTTSMTA
mmetsp:Transcript_29986/g.77731  ORF Transcript_29986/g.77731 Transcript_29986/m.77731 type:complete len:265 (+) Transcript_29986:390-1184(+)